MGQNDKLNFWQLSRKTVLLILLSTMCHSGELKLLKLSEMIRSIDGLRFRLTTPTKSFNMFNFHHHKALQVMHIPQFKENPLLCPVLAIYSYITMTAVWQGEIQELFIVTTTSPIHPAAPYTINNWAKQLMVKAGLGGFTDKSSRSSSSTAGLLCGVSLDQLMARCGWAHPSTFVKHLYEKF